MRELALASDRPRGALEEPYDRRLDRGVQIVIALPRREVLPGSIPLHDRLRRDDAGIERDERVRDLEGGGGERPAVALVAADHRLGAASRGAPGAPRCPPG